MSLKNESGIFYGLFIIVLFVILCVASSLRTKLKENELRLEKIEGDLSVLSSNVDMVDSILNVKIGNLERKLAPELIR